MSGGMPYQLEKGTTFSVTESVLDDLDLRVHALLFLRQNPEASFDTQPTLNSTSLDDPRAPTKQQRYDHQTDWYGKDDPQKPNQWVQLPYGPGNRTTGYWRNWYGDSRGIVREVWVRAIEVSLGVPHEPKEIDEVTVRGQIKRQWPIEVFWRCPAPWFEGWVTWRGTKAAREGDYAVDPGHVTVHFHTPSHDGGGLILSPLRPGNPDADYRQDPLAASGGKLPDSIGERGMWVIAQTTQQLMNPSGELIPSPGTTAQPGGAGQGDWKVDQIPVGASYVSTGDVVVVQPSEPDGGVVAGGRAYRP